MPKAERDFTTRRTLLRGAAVLTCTSLAATPAAAFRGKVAEAIQEHRAAQADMELMLTEYNRLEVELPKEQRLTFLTVWDREVVETDDPAWVASEHAKEKAHDRIMAAADGLVMSVDGASDAELVTLLLYVAAYNREHPDCLHTNFTIDNPKYSYEGYPFEAVLIDEIAKRHAEAGQ